MDNEKELQTEELTEEIKTDAVEETVETVEDVPAEEAPVEEAPAKKTTVEKVYLCSECGQVTEDEVCPVCQKALTKEELFVCKAQTQIEASKKTTKKVVAIVVAIAVIIAVIFGGLCIYKNVYNPYNHGEYKELAFGKTLGELAKEQGMDCCGKGYKKFLEENGYAENMPKSTYVYVAMQLVKMGDLISEEQLQMYGMTLEDFFNEYGLGDKGFDKNTTRGEFEGAQTMKDYFGVETEEDFNKVLEQNPELKELNLTLDTQFKDVRKAIYEVIESKRIESDKPEEEAPAT